MIAIPLILVFLYHAGFVSVDWRKSTTLYVISWWGKGELIHVICFLCSFLSSLLRFPLPLCPHAPLLLCLPASLLPCSPTFLCCLSLFSCPCPLNVMQSSDLFVCSIYFQNLGYALDPEGERFDNMKDLLRHYYKFNLPKCDVKLTSPYK